MRKLQRLTVVAGAVETIETRYFHPHAISGFDPGGQSIDVGRPT
jgi:hypothetical protein